MISELLESVWELTDTTGLRLVNNDSMRHVWEVQQKHPECLQDPPGVALYTKVGTLQKGSKELDTLRCGRGSSSLESFHRHQCAFIPGWRCNAVHMQMYMLEGASRWNMGRAKEAVAVEGASTLRTLDVRLMSHLNNMSQRVHGCALVPEFTPPGKPTGERIAVEYLLAQTNRGDLLASKQVPEILSQVLEEDEDEPDTTCACQMILGLLSLRLLSLSNQLSLGLVIQILQVLWKTRYAQKAKKKGRTCIRRTMESTQEAKWLCSWTAGSRETIHDSQPSSPGP
ncbi:hypothetical protein D5F01_LYC02072 [Larimichthys crocea]|uniref:Uncharacterized protein n=1 Tax=Larimichthys crocea TaxID=215358 RepID=A0A6G0J875_LARCR|nr:hypothetical protein D5F01_LYC02072 [Larimichthys crocea]